MEQTEFEGLVSEALAALPLDIKDLVDNIEVVVAPFPSERQMRRSHIRNRYNLLGLYEGVPLTRRGAYYGMVLPDKITIFQAPIEAIATTPEDLARLVRRVTVHEMAHHFGISDERLRELGY